MNLPEHRSAQDPWPEYTQYRHFLNFFEVVRRLSLVHEKHYFKRLIDKFL